MSVLSRFAAAAALTALIAIPHAVSAADKWVDLAFASGWASSAKENRPASATKSGDVITLSGLANRTSGTWGHIATLPPDMRPAERLVFNVSTHDRTARVDVLTNGQVHFMAGNKAHNWVSLDGISYSTDKGKALKLNPGWADYGQGYAGASTVSDGDTVFVGGVVKPGKDNVIATLSADLRPAKRLVFNLNSHDETSRVDVFPDGRIVWVYRAPKSDWVSLNGITFDRTPGAPLKLLNGWKAHSDAAFATASAKRVGNRVSVSGLTAGSRWGYIATLPRDMCPESRLIFNLNNHDSTARVDVLEDCRILWVAGGKKHGWINLTGITFNVGKPARAAVASTPVEPEALPWVRVPGGATDIGVGANGSVWVIGENRKSAGNDIWRYSGGNKWESIPGAAVRIAVDPEGAAWIVDGDGKIHHWDGALWQTVPGGATDIAVGADGTVWVIGNNKKSGGYGIWRYKGKGNWQSIPGSALRIAVDPEGKAWVTNSKYQIFRYDGRKWDLVPGAAVDIGIGADNDVWIVGTDAAPYRWSGKDWIKHVGGIAQISVDPKGYPWAINAGHAIWADKRAAGYKTAPKPVASAFGVDDVQKDLRKNPAFANAPFADLDSSDGVLTANVRVGSKTAKLFAWRSGANRPFVSALVIPEISIRHLLPKLASANKLSNYELVNVVVFTVPSGAENLSQKVSALPKAVSDAVKATDPNLKDAQAEIPLAPGMTYVGGLKTTGFLKTATDLMGLVQPVSVNGSLALTSYAAPQNEVTLTARFAHDPLANVLKNAPIKVITVAKSAKPELYVTATGTTDIEIGYRSIFRIFGEDFDGTLSFGKSGTGADTATSIAIKMAKDGKWVDPKLLSSRVQVKGITLNDAEITLQREIDNRGSSDSLSIVTDSTKIHGTTYKPAAFSFTIDSTGTFPKAAYVNLATSKLTIRQMAELADVASQMSPQGQIANYGMGAIGPFSPGKLIETLRLGDLPIDKIAIKNPKIYFATAGAVVPMFDPPVSPPLPTIFGAGVHVRGGLETFGREIASGGYQLDFKGLDIDTKIDNLPFGSFVLSKPRFELKAAFGAAPSASFSGGATIVGIKIASTKISIGADAFHYDIRTGCVGTARFAMNDQTKGFVFSIPKPTIEFCIPDALETLADALAAGQRFAAVGSQLVQGIGEDTWHGLRALGNGKIDASAVTNVIKTYGNPVNAAENLAKSGAKAAEKFVGGFTKFFGSNDKKVEPKYFITPDKCSKELDDWSLEYAACWRRGHELIRLAMDPTLCISVRLRIREKGKAIEVWKCDGGWHQQWRRLPGGGNVADGHAPKRVEWCWEEQQRKNYLESRPCDKKQRMQWFNRDQYDRLTYIDNNNKLKCLQVENAVKDGADIYFNDCHLDGTGQGRALPHQKWVFVENSSFGKPTAPTVTLRPDEKFRSIRSVTSNTCLAAVPSSAPDRTPARMLPCSRVDADGSKWQWANGMLKSKSGKCLVARLVLDSPVVEHVSCNAGAAKWKRMFKAGGNVMFETSEGHCLGALSDGRLQLMGCSMELQYVRFDVKE